MRVREPKTAEVRAIEALMLEKFRSEPFHNLYLLLGYPQTTLSCGGTCSDKTLSFHQAVRGLGVAASLHSAFIGGQEIHRLVKVQSGGRSFFADVGNGWPSIHLYPLDREVSYTCYGMHFRSVIDGRCLRIYNRRQGVERHQMDVPFDSKPEDLILADIADRFDCGIVYPFSGGLRFSQVVGERFLFLREHRLEIYGEHEPFHVVEEVGRSDLAEALRTWFGFDLGLLAGSEKGGSP